MSNKLAYDDVHSEISRKSYHFAHLGALSKVMNKETLLEMENLLRYGTYIGPTLIMSSPALIRTFSYRWWMDVWRCLAF